MCFLTELKVILRLKQTSAIQLCCAVTISNNLSNDFRAYPFKMLTVYPCISSVGRMTRWDPTF
jgi:hypothetical protein